MNLILGKAEPAIEIRALTKRFKNGTLANDNIDLEVPTGTIFGLLGPNGAGKTTLVRQLTGELRPTSGDIRVVGIDVVKDPMRVKREMAVVPQEAGTFELLTPVEHLEIFGRLRGLSKQEAKDRAEVLLTQLRLQEHRKKVSHHLSGGLKRKLLVGTALIARPRVLVLDEPTTGLDPNSRREVWNLIHAATKDGATVLLTTHYMEEAEALCGRIAIVGEGRILATGSIEDIRAMCSNRYKATYEEEGATRTVYGETHRLVTDEIEKLGIVEYALTKTTLEDLYLELTAASVTPIDG